MKVLWVGDAVVSSGFARCTHAACDALHEAGHEVHVLGINYFGDPHDYPYKIYPCHHPFKGGSDYFGVYRLRNGLLAEIDPDVVVFLNDPWNIPNYITALQYASTDTGKAVPPSIGWLAVDGKNQPQGAVNSLHHICTWTEFGAQEIRNSGYRGPTSIVPLGVDLESFQPHDKAESRSRVAIDGEPLDPDDFIVGYVGRNQTRKRLDLTIQYFAEFAQDKPNAKLLIHSAPTGNSAFDLERLAVYYGVDDKLILSTGVLGDGLDKSVMPVLYSSMDVFLTTTQGEGWGLCVLEAMACGVPCVVPNWSGLGDWASDAALLVPCLSTAITAPLEAGAYTIGGVPDRAITIQCLNMLYDSQETCREYGERGLKRARTLTWDRTGWEFLDMIEKVVCQQ